MTDTERNPPLLDAGRSALLIVDMQERLLPTIAGGDAVAHECARLIAAARRLSLPIACSEHCPEAIGSTVPHLRARLAEQEVVSKTTFSCLGTAGLRTVLMAPTVAQVVVCGVETHVCVLQTVLGLLPLRQVFVVADAVASRSAGDRGVALDRMAREGARIVTVEMALFEWLRRADHPAFRDLLAIVKDRRS